MASDPKNMVAALKDIECSNAEAQQAVAKEKLAHNQTKAELNSVQSTEAAIKARIEALDSEVTSKEKHKEMKMMEIQRMCDGLAMWDAKRNQLQANLLSSKQKLKASLREATEKVKLIDQTMRDDIDHHHETGVPSSLSTMDVQLKRKSENDKEEVVMAHAAGQRLMNQGDQDVESLKLESEICVLRPRSQKLSEDCGRLSQECDDLQAECQRLYTEMQAESCVTCGQPLLTGSEDEAKQCA